MPVYVYQDQVRPRRVLSLQRVLRGLAEHERRSSQNVSELWRSDREDHRRGEYHPLIHSHDKTYGQEDP